MPRPTRLAAPIENGGFHSRHGQVQAAGIELALPCLARAAEAVLLNGVPIILAEFGCSRGRNSMALTRRAITVLRDRTTAGTPLWVAHVDRPSNDFAALFQLLDEDPESYARLDPDVFPAAIGRPFHQQVLPSQSVTLGWSSYTAHWLSRVPADAPGAIHPMLTAPGIREKFQRQAQGDWLAFLLARLQELKRGGQFVFVVPSPAGPWGQGQGDGYLRLWRMAESVLDGMVNEGVLGAHERQRMIVPIYARDMSELLAPLATEVLSRAQLIEHHLAIQPDPAWDRFEADGDGNALAEAYALFFQGAFTPSLEAGLDPARETEERHAFGVRMCTGLKQRILAEPRRMLDFGLAIVVIARL